MPDFQGLMRSVSDSDDTAYVLSRDFRLLEVNAAFERFARENGGKGLLAAWQQRSIIEAIPLVLRTFFVEAFERALATGKPWEHEYECSSAEMYRRLHMIAYPIEGEHLLLVHSIGFEAPHTREAELENSRIYEVQGFVKMCSHCRRVHNPRSEGDRWDWVPNYLDGWSARVSHGLCPPCAAFYWPVGGTSSAQPPGQRAP